MSDETTTTAPRSVNDLKTGMELKGVVKQIELYGAFVNVGIGQDALLHISQLGKPNVRNVDEVVKVGDEITVYVLKVHKDTGRIALSMVKPPAINWDELGEGQMVTGKVVRIEKFGVFVDIGAERPGMIHISELAEGYVKTPEDVVRIGDDVEARVIKINRKKRQIDLSLKPVAEPVAIIEEEPEDESLTAMAMAFRRAMSEDDFAASRPSGKKRDKRDRRDNKSSREREEIFARTLRRRND